MTKLVNNYSEEDDSILTLARYFLADIKLRLNQQYFDENGRNNMRYAKKASKLLNKVEESSFEYPEIWFKLALVKSYLGRFEQAKQIYEKLNLHFPDNYSAKMNLARLVIDFEEDFAYAEKLFQECLKIDKNSFNTWLGISYLKQKQGKMDDFYEACKKLLELSSTLEEKKIANNNIGEYYRNKNDFEKAIEYFQKSLEIDKKFENSIGGYIECLWNLKRYDEIVEFTNDLEYNKENKYHLKMRGYVFSYMDKHKEALEIINACIKKFSDDLKYLSDLYDSKGDFLIRSGDIIDALDYFQRSLDTGEEDYEFKAKTREKIKKYKNRAIIDEK